MLGVEAKFTYFKRTGKWYSEGHGHLPMDPALHSKYLFRHAFKGNLPGISGRGGDFFILVEAEGHVPFLVLPEGNDE